MYLVTKKNRQVARSSSISAYAYDRKAVRYVYFAGDNKSKKTGLSVDFEDSACILVAITIYQFELPQWIKQVTIQTQSHKNFW